VHATSPIGKKLGKGVEGEVSLLRALGAKDSVLTEPSPEGQFTEKHKGLAKAVKVVREKV
jgi:hypothetical protein